MIKEEFELYKSELSYLRAKKVKVEALAKRDQMEIAFDVGSNAGEGPVVEQDGGADGAEVAPT
jgi:hypothetical protein